jgi:hypothetical protein
LRDPQVSGEGAERIGLFASQIGACRDDIKHLPQSIFRRPRPNLR